jgi:hypothetical protein
LSEDDDIELIDDHSFVGYLKNKINGRESRGRGIGRRPKQTKKRKEGKGKKRA